MSLLVRSPALALLAAALALAASGCGDDEPTAATGTTATPTASVPAASAPPPDATQPGTAPSATQTTPGRTEATGGAGADGAGSGGAPPVASGEEEEEAVRVPAAFVVTVAGLEPPQVTVPPLLAVELSVRADDGRAHRIEVRTPQPAVLEVAAGGRAAVRIDGLRAGRYPVLVDGREAGALVAGGEVGP